MLTLGERLHGGLIVSCQALPDEPLYGSEIMARMAIAAVAGGAIGIRANGSADIAAIRKITTLPIIGLSKVTVPGYAVYITPTVATASEVSMAGADIIAIDATARVRPEGSDIAGFIEMVRTATGKPILADISTEEEGLQAEASGADFISTTMSGYTDYSPRQKAPDMKLLERLTKLVRVPVIAEGRYCEPAQVCQALDYGAWAVVVGGAITRPQQITARFVESLRERS